MLHTQLNKDKFYAYLFVYCILIAFAMPVSQSLKNAPLTFRPWQPIAQPLAPSPLIVERQGARPNGHPSPRPASLAAALPDQTKFVPSQLSVAEWVNVPAFSLPVIQQPPDDAVYVSTDNDRVTQFRLAYQNGVTALLAHNYLSGTKFYALKIGQVVSVTYTDQSIRHYTITRIDRYQKVNPSRLQSNLIDLSSHKIFTSTEVFNRYYRGDHHVIFQTCLESDGLLNWGLYFVVAAPVDHHRIPPV